MSFDGAGGDARCVLVESRKEFRHTAILPSPAPTPEFQLAFLTKIEELLARGKFTSTYKFALLIEDDAPLGRALAEKRVSCWLIRSKSTRSRGNTSRCTGAWLVRIRR